MRRSILFAIGSRANWSSLAPVVRACKLEHSCHILAYASAILPRYGDVASDIEREHGDIIRVATLLEGGEPEQMAATAGVTISAITPVLKRLKPDYVFVVGDRYEVLPVAYAAHLLGIRVAHSMGGELSGTVDESVRHAITKLAHIHFVATARSAERVSAMGERSVHVVGCPRLDLARPFLGSPRGRDVLVMQHPVTSEWEQAGEQMRITLEAVERVRGDRPVHVFWPNADAGTEAIVNAVRNHHATYLTHRNLPPEKFLELLATCAVIVGNSSAAIREGSFLGTPAVNVGTRQQLRERAENCVDAPHDANFIYSELDGELMGPWDSWEIPGQYPSSHLYGDGHSAERIATILAGELPALQKVWAA